jgi:hypothetical protein
MVSPCKTRGGGAGGLYPRPSQAVQQPCAGHAGGANPASISGKVTPSAASLPACALASLEALVAVLCLPPCPQSPFDLGIYTFANFVYHNGTWHDLDVQE